MIYSKKETISSGKGKIISLVTKFKFVKKESIENIMNGCFFIDRVIDQALDP